MNNVNWNPIVIHCGVPHRTILAPFLFLIFINNITIFSKRFKYIIYAGGSILSTCIPGDNVMALLN